MKITLLGTGTSTGVPIPACRCDVCTSDNPRNNRLRASALIEVQEIDSVANGSKDIVQTVLIDTCTDLRQQALKYDIRNLDAVLYTHNHADHIYGFEELRAFNFINKKLIPLYANEGTAKELLKKFDYALDPNPNYLGGALPKITLDTIEPYKPMNFGGIDITPLTIYHGNDEILGYKAKSFAYMTDCSGIPDETKEHLYNLDVIILDGLRYRPHKTHFTQEQAIRVLEELNPKKAFLTHISHDVDYKQGNKKIKEWTDADIELAYDGLVIEI